MDPKDRVVRRFEHAYFGRLRGREPWASRHALFERQHALGQARSRRRWPAHARHTGDLAALQAKLEVFLRARQHLVDITLVEAKMHAEANAAAHHAQADRAGA